MAITENKLRQIIREEASRLVEQAAAAADPAIANKATEQMAAAFRAAGYPVSPYTDKFVKPGFKYYQVKLPSPSAPTVALMDAGATLNDATVVGNQGEVLVIGPNPYKR